MHGYIRLFKFLFLNPPVTLSLALIVVVLLIVLGKIPIGYNLRSLRVRWLTTLLTALAFTLVIALLTVMLAFVDGMYRLTSESGQPGNVIVLSEGSTDEAFSNLTRSNTGDIAYFPGVLRNEADTPMCSKETYLVVTQPFPPEANQPQRRRFVQLRGIEEPEIAAEVHGLKLASGRWFCEAGVAAVPRKGGSEEETDTVVEAVLGQGVAAQLGNDRGAEPVKVGDLFQLGDGQWACVGIMQTAGTTFGSEIWAKRTQVGGKFGKESYTSIVLRAQNEPAAKALATDLKDNYTKAALQPLTEREYYDKLSDTNKQFTFGIAVVTIFIAVGGVFGVMNTMLAAISQRTKDIGVLRILGFARWQILACFLLESLFIALAGGLLGCAIGSLCHGLSATSVASSGAGGGKTIMLTLVVTPKTLVIGMLLALGMGLLGGILPAFNAMRLRPLEALR